METELIWSEDMEFHGKGESGHEVILDASEASGGHNKGPRPMELLLNGLAGCTAIDIVAILKKMKINLEDFKIKVEAQRAEKHPRRFTDIYLNYLLKGEGLTEHKVERAINLSLDKYCSASNSFNANIDFSYDILD